MAHGPRIGVQRYNSVYGGTQVLSDVKVNITRMFTGSEFNLPHSVTQCQFDPSNFYYDFHIEYDVVRRAQERERARLAAVADATDKSSNSDSPTPLAASQIYESARGDNVLQPTVCTADTTSSLTMTTPAQTSGLISYSEFENQSSNPFEDMELRTLDDMGELRTILQPAGDVSSVQPVPDLNSQGSASVESAGAKPVPKPRLNVPNTNEGDQGKAPVPVPRPRVKSSQNDSSAMAVKLPAGAKPTVLQAAMKQPSQPQPEPPPYPGPPLASTVGSYPTFTPPLESFPSPSDLPPPYGANADGPPPIPPRLPNQRNGNQWGGNHQPHSDLGLVNVYQTLNSAEGRLVDELCGMGFPQGQVARAVKRLGMDEKTVVDFLVDIQKIVDMPLNYSQDSVELSLTKNNGDVKKTLECLRTVNQLKELGFPEKTIHEALHATGNDKDKAIEFIISHS